MNVYQVSVLQSSYLLTRIVVAKDGMTAAKLVLDSVNDAELLELVKKYEVDFIQEVTDPL